MSVVDLDHRREVAEMTRELASVSRDLMTQCMTVELAIARKDWRTMHDSAEAVKLLDVRFRELHRGLLVKGIRG